VVLRRRRHAEAPPLAAPPIDAGPAPEPWPADPDVATALLDEPADAWMAAAEPIDVTDHTIELPALAPMPRRRAALAGRAALTLALVLGCAGAAVAATGVLKSEPQDSPPPTVGEASVVAPAKPHKAKPAAHRHKAKPVRHKRAHRARHARHHVASPRIVAAAPSPAPAAAPVRSPSPAPVRHVVSRPAPQPAPKPSAPRPPSSQPAASPQPAASAPSGEPGRQPPPSP
jgi:hypothetical protein